MKQVQGIAGTEGKIFHGCQIVLDLDAAQVRFKQKQELRKKITDNGGIVSYIITKKSTHLIVSNAEKANDSYKGRMAQKYGVPILGMGFIDICLDEEELVDAEPHIVCGTSVTQEFSSGKIVTGPASSQEKPKPSKVSAFNINKIRVFPIGSDQAPKYPDELYELAKWALLQRTDPKTKECSFYLLELHVIPPGGPSIRDEVTHPFRVMVHHGKLSEMKSDSGGIRESRYSQTSEEALQVFSFLFNQRTTSPWNMTKTKKLLSRWIGSAKYRKVILERGMTEEPLTEEVARLVDHVWQEALGQLSDILTAPVETIAIDKVEKAESVLLQIKRCLDQSETTKLKELSQEFYSLLPQKSQQEINTRSMIAKKQNLCQLVKDIVGVSEATNWSTRSSLDAKYCALCCHIESLPENHHEYNDIKNRVLSSQTGNDIIKVRHIYAVSRAVEETNFVSQIANKKMLFHASRPANFVGILSRGLLLPKIVVDDFGGERTDAGMLGSAIYFADSSSTSAKYSSASQTTGTRLMTINEVALGKCQEVNKYHKELTEAPQGYHSVHGVKGTELYASDFKDDELAVYDTSQQRIRYLVEFMLPEDKPKEHNVAVEMAAILNQDDSDVEMASGDQIDLFDVQSITDPLSKIQAGLLSKSDQPVPLKAVHVRAKLLDLAAEVVVLQVYTNENNDPIEAKYVFPLDDMAAVCGFEAFINDKHIIGEVKEKETAHKEYKEAISKGHGAYLMDEETPDVFTVSVGNLPPKTTVVIKIVYMAELTVDGDRIVFGLPGSVAPWKKDAALSEVTQTDLETVKIDKEMKGNLSVQVSIEMPYDIRTLESPTHPIRIKRTASKATVSLADGCTRLDDGFQLQIGLAEIHVPRMWVERHPSKKDSQACMLTFYPEFEANTDESSEVILMLDLSNSMRGESLREAKKVALLALHHLPENWRFNIVVFGTAFDELFANSQPKNAINTKKAQSFINSLEASMGSTEAWHPLHAYFLLRAGTLRNVFLISDGHINNEEATLNAVHDNAMYTRLFTFGVSSTANRHLLRSLARVGAGAFQFFDSKVKSKWEGKIKSQLNKAAQPVLTSVNVAWQQFDNHAPRPIQAPNQITSLFSGSRQVVYGYVPFCTQATLKAMIAGREVSTMVSTHELSITEGKMLHQLTARAIIRDWEDGTLDVNRTEHEVKKTEQKNYIIELSKEYSIVTQVTSFVAIETRDKDEYTQDKQGVNIIELLKKEEIDTLAYMGWEPTKTPPGQPENSDISVEETVQDLLEKAKKEELSSILTAQRYYDEALELTKEKVFFDDPLFYKAMFDIVKFYYDVQGNTDKIDDLIQFFKSLQTDKTEGRTKKGHYPDIWELRDIIKDDRFLEDVQEYAERMISEKRCPGLNKTFEEMERGLSGASCIELHVNAVQMLGPEEDSDEDFAAGIHAWQASCLELESARMLYPEDCDDFTAGVRAESCRLGAALDDDDDDLIEYSYEVSKLDDEFEAGGALPEMLCEAMDDEELDEDLTESDDDDDDDFGLDLFGDMDYSFAPTRSAKKSHRASHFVTRRMRVVEPEKTAPVAKEKKKKKWSMPSFTPKDMASASLSLEEETAPRAAYAPPPLPDEEEASSQSSFLTRITRKATISSRPRLKTSVQGNMNLLIPAAAAPAAPAPMAMMAAAPSTEGFYDEGEEESEDDMGFDLFDDDSPTPDEAKAVVPKKGSKSAAAPRIEAMAPKPLKRRVKLERSSRTAFSRLDSEAEPSSPAYEPTSPGGVPHAAFDATTRPSSPPKAMLAEAPKPEDCLGSLAFVPKSSGVVPHAVFDARPSSHAPKAMLAEAPKPECVELLAFVPKSSGVAPHAAFDARLSSPPKAMLVEAPKPEECLGSLAFVPKSSGVAPHAAFDARLSSPPKAMLVEAPKPEECLGSLAFVPKSSGVAPHAAFDARLSSPPKAMLVEAPKPEECLESLAFVPKSSGVAPHAAFDARPSSPPKAMLVEAPKPEECLGSLAFVPKSSGVAPHAAFDARPSPPSLANREVHYLSGKVSTASLPLAEAEPSTSAYEPTSSKLPSPKVTGNRFIEHSVPPRPSVSSPQTAFGARPSSPPKAAHSRGDLDAVLAADILADVSILMGSENRKSIPASGRPKDSHVHRANIPTCPSPPKDRDTAKKFSDPTPPVQRSDRRARSSSRAMRFSDSREVNEYEGVAEREKSTSYVYSEGRLTPAPASKRLQQTQAQVDEVVDIMRVNVDKVLERDQKLSELDDRAEALQVGASQFEASAGKLKKKKVTKELLDQNMPEMFRDILQEFCKEMALPISEESMSTMYEEWRAEIPPTSELVDKEDPWQYIVMKALEWVQSHDQVKEKLALMERDKGESSEVESPATPQYDTCGVQVEWLRKAGAATKVRQMVHLQTKDGYWELTTTFLFTWGCKYEVTDFKALFRKAGFEESGETFVLVMQILATVIAFLELEQHRGIHKIPAEGNMGDEMCIRRAVANGRKWFEEQQDLHPGLLFRVYPGFSSQDWIEIGRTILGLEQNTP